MPTLRSYLVDGDGEYILSDPANPSSRIITDEYIYGVTDTAWQRVASATGRRCPVQSFDIKRKDDTTWHLSINKKRHIGIYPSQDAAIQVLMGLFIKNSGNLDQADEAASYQLSTERSFIDIIPTP